MADAVQYRLEGMIPELEDLQSRGIFSPEEIKGIVKKRTNFEYAMKKRATELGDYLRYVQYEIGLDKLRRQRKKELGTKIKGTGSISENAIVKRIHFIFERAVQKFKGDERLWLQYIEFSNRAGGKKTLNKIFARALQFHPFSATLWTRAAHWELEGNANMTAARVLMQRALRMNPESKVLWVNYFVLEIMYILKLIDREKDLFGTDAEGNMSLTNPNATPAIAVPQLEGESAEPVKSIVSTEGVRTIISGVIPRVVYNKACEALPDSFAFRLSFLEPCGVFEGGSALRKHIVADVLTTFGAGNKCWEGYARWLLKHNTASSGAVAAAEANEGVFEELFAEAALQCPTPAMHMVQVRLYWEQLNAVGASSDADENKELVGRLTQNLLRLCEAAPQYGSAEYVTVWSKVLLNVGLVEDAAKVIDRGVKEVGAAHANDETLGEGLVGLWRLKVWLALRQCCGGLADPAAVTATMDQAVAACGRAPGASAVWRDYFEYMSTQKASMKVVTALYQRAVVALGTSGGAADISVDYVMWARSVMGLAAARDAYDLVFKLTTPSRHFLRTCLAIEQANGDAAKGTGTDRVRLLLEKACGLFGVHDHEVWLDFIKHETAQGAYDRAGQLHWKALQTLASPAEFSRLYQEMK